MPFFTRILCIRVEKCGNVQSALSEQIKDNLGKLNTLWYDNLHETERFYYLPQ